MKGRKKLLLLVMTIILPTCFMTSVYAENQTFTLDEFNNTIYTESLFYIDDSDPYDASATVAMSFIGNENATHAILYSRLQVKINGVWTDIPNGLPYNRWEDAINDNIGFVEHTIDITQRGEYRAIFAYYIYGSLPTDVIGDLLIDTY